MSLSLLTERLKKVGFQLTADQIEGILEDASKHNVPYSEFLDTLLLREIEFQEEKAFQQRMKGAKLPYIKRIEDFDFTFQQSINERRVKEVLTCRFIENGENILLLGPPGVGKTHLAIGFTVEALQRGYSAYYTRCDDFIAACKKAEQNGTTSRLISKLCRRDILVLDEIGYFPFDERSATIFFQVVSQRYEKGSIILTSNKSYVDWGNVFGDDILATAVLDRLLHHSTTFNIKGNSYRLREKQKAGVQPIPVER